jgi:hypothetical protein
MGMDCKGLNAAVTYAIYHLPAYKGHPQIKKYLSTTLT